MPVGRKFVDGPVAIGGGNRIDPFGGKLGQVVGCHGSAQSLGCAQDGAGNFAFVKGGCAVLGDKSQCSREIGILEDLSNCRRFAVGQKDAAAFGIFSDPIGGVGPVGLNDFRNRIAIVRIENRGLEKILPGEVAEAFVERLPACYCTGNRHGVDAAERHGGRVLGSYMGDSQAAGSPSAGVEAVELTGFGVPVNGEEIAAHAVHHGLGHAECCIRGDCRIYGGTSALQNLRACYRSLHMAGGYDAVAGDDHGAGGGAVLS